MSALPSRSSTLWHRLCKVRSLTKSDSSDPHGTCTNRPSGIRDYNLLFTVVPPKILTSNSPSLSEEGDQSILLYVNLSATPNPLRPGPAHPFCRVKCPSQETVYCVCTLFSQEGKSQKEPDSKQYTAIFSFVSLSLPSCSITFTAIHLAETNTYTRLLIQCCKNPLKLLFFRDFSKMCLLVCPAQWHFQLSTSTLYFYIYFFKTI